MAEGETPRGTGTSGRSNAVGSVRLLLPRVLGIAAPFRGRGTPLADGRVRQFLEQYSEEEQAWKPGFEGFYSRIDPAAMP